MGSSKRGPDNKQSITDHTRNLHLRLQQALNLGTRRPQERPGRKWQCTDIQIQKQVVRLISAYLDSVSGVVLHNPLFKNSVPDIVEALVCTLECKNEALLSMATNATLKLVSTLPSSIMESHVLDLVSPLSSLISHRQTDIATACAKALTIALPNRTIANEKEVWDVVKRTESVSQAINNIRSFSRGAKPIEYFQQMVLLLSKVLLRWPPSRFSVWSDALLLQTLYDALANWDSDSFVKVEVLRLLSAIALCDSGAMKLLQNGEGLLEAMVQCMDSSQPHSVRVEGFKLAQGLALNAQRAFKMLSFCCEPFIRALISGISEWRMKSRKVSNDQISLIVEARILALITRWGGKHHKLFWRYGIDKVLLDLLLENFHNQLHDNSLSLKGQISIARESLNSNYSLVVRDHIWDILGCLATHWEEDFHSERHKKKLSIDMLITCACVAFVDTIQKWITHDLQRESVIRAVLLMIHSPCTYIASKIRFVLSEVLRPNRGHILKHLLSTLKNIPSRNNFDRLQIMSYVMALACYIGLPEFRVQVLELSGVRTLFTLLTWCLSNGVNEGSLGSTLYLHNSLLGRTCCLVSLEDWEGEDIIVLYILWGLGELIKHSTPHISNNLHVSSGGMRYSVPELLNNLWEICINTSAPGVRWFATFALSALGLYGFPSKLGNRIGKALSEEDHKDIRLILANGDCLSVHGVILAIRCPSLLPFEEFHISEETNGSSVPSSMGMGDRFQKEIRLSSHVDHQALSRLLDFVYFGYLQAEEELVKKLKTLAKRCNLQPLLQMLCCKVPKWGTPFPSYDLSLALGPVGHRFSDVIMEAKANETLVWTCDFCSVLVPHVHVHKVILASSCDYLHGLFCSGMMESHSKSMKVDISWEAMVKLVAWFYTDKLPNPPSGCMWENMNVEEKLHELQPYVELCWLTEFWCLENVQKACSDVIVSRLDSSGQLSVKIMQTAAHLSVEKLVEVAVICAAPFFRELWESGELGDLDEVLVDRIRFASVELSQERPL
ncbi:BTB/POZ domain-containing protein [Morus notabilis]|uniref:BTB/POZ domain-containing protein n=2 Tax=Morus notabilis TaxID=981085 RepID=W9SCB0_9ROSA|nr:BTB/POZ domain-containing protein At1g04390 [Morus notabilis]EXC21326.1 BTB/POZ domain-containing protein [Morus notabilis]